MAIFVTGALALWPGNPLLADKPFTHRGKLHNRHACLGCFSGLKARNMVDLLSRFARSFNRELEMLGRPTLLFGAALLLSPALSGCGKSSSNVEDAYDAIVQAYLDGRLDEVYDLIEPETRGMLDATNRALGQADPELQDLDERERFRKMWGERRQGMYPMWLLVPGEVAEVQSKDDLAVLTINVDAEKVNPTFRLKTRTVYMVKHDGVWKLTAASRVESKLRRARMTQ